MALIAGFDNLRNSHPNIWTQSEWIVFHFIKSARRFKSFKHAKIVLQICHGL